MNYKVSIIIFLIIAGFVFLWQVPEFRFIITGKIGETAQPTTANVTITGYIGSIVVTPLLINFTPTATSGLQPASSYNPKQNGGTGYITVSLNSTSNSPFDLYINATLLTSTSGGYTIPVANISVNSSCNASGGPYPLYRLSNSLIPICTPTVGQSVPIYSSANIYFYLDVPAGQTNHTYFGSIWLFANYSGVSSNSTWYGPNNTTATVRKYIEVSWNSSSTPISFGTLAPGSKSNATPETFPSDIISGAATNVFIDWYINGTNLISVPYSIIAGNLTYANATRIQYWPNGTKDLLTYFPPSSTNGDFPNWGNVRNASDTWVWFNISIPAGQQAGTYVGNLTARAVEKGEDPTP